MKFSSAIAVASAATGAAAAAAANKVVARQSSTGSASLPTITIKGNAFFNGDERFYLRGVDYQPGGSSAGKDPLADYDTCSRDIAVFKQIGINSIRVYEVDNTANHDQCMNALAEAGIYLALDINSPGYSINRNTPAPSYNAVYLQSVFATIDAFAGYSNLLLFFSGNEDINSVDTTQSAPFVKAVTRDMKRYIVERGYRSIPVGYAAADVSKNQYLMGQYMDCGDSQERSDFYAINNYEWCSPSSFTQSGWSSLVAQYSNYSLPVFFSEYGCVQTARDFSEISVLYNTEMTGVFSGGLVYQYSEEGAGWGLVTINGNTVTPKGDQVTLLTNALKNTPDPSNGGGYSTSGVVQNCPPQSSDWNTSPFTGDALPATPEGAEQYFKNGAGAGPGLTGNSQNDGPALASTAGSSSAPYSTYGSGSGSGSATSSPTHSPGAAASLHAPSVSATLFCGVLAFTLAGFGFGAATVLF